MQHALALQEKYDHVFLPDLVRPFFYEYLYSFSTIWCHHYKHIMHSAVLKMLNVI